MVASAPHRSVAASDADGFGACSSIFTAALAADAQPSKLESVAHSPVSTVNTVSSAGRFQTTSSTRLPGWGLPN